MRCSPLLFEVPASKSTWPSALTTFCTKRGQRGGGRGHVDRAGFVLAQHNPVVGWPALAVLGQRVLNTGKTGRDAGLVRGVRHGLRSVLEFEHQAVVRGVQRKLE